MSYTMVVLKEYNDKSAHSAYEEEFYTYTASYGTGKKIIEEDVDNLYIGYIIKDSDGKIVDSYFKEEINNRIKEIKRKNKFTRFDIMDL